jgi:uncharacterized protein (DUF1499 family)
MPWLLKQMAPWIPPIHDITTDTDNPPAFAAVLPLRKPTSNPAEYGGPGIAAQQQALYPDIRPLVLKKPFDQAFAQALNAAQKMGWALVAVDANAGRIEATDTTRWLRFKDDIVIRVTRQGEDSRVDVRSMSRIGKSDFGTNARRIREYLRELGGGTYKGRSKSH